MIEEELILYFENLITWVEENCCNDETKLIIKSKFYFEINKLKRRKKKGRRNLKYDNDFDIEKDYLINSLGEINV